VVTKNWFGEIYLGWWERATLILLNVRCKVRMGSMCEFGGAMRPQNLLLIQFLGKSS
jgi:hypothetical protein